MQENAVSYADIFLSLFFCALIIRRAVGLFNMEYGSRWYRHGWKK